ncbi:MAG TPA: hypothetical protein ENH14_01710 [candidate division WOR-3 bacterium]|uniref:Glycosyl transferase family 28 C-terminal domain-containing protein n=1 Tax=candidate division WOR-3 bacterium TaxID=2052148 RepID=A0A7V0LUS1_UNCW3|nr:hypothetical protein [candidate division WOR-3 bacterium]
MKITRSEKMNCLFLVSDEGYGHTVRQSCIANELVKKGAKITFQCRDPIPLATKILDKRIKINEYFNLIRLVKREGGVDVERTYNLFQNYITRSKEWIRDMLNSPHVLNADLIVTDIVEEAGVLSKELNKPAVAISHFTWHWLLRELDPKFEEVSQYLEECLSGISEFLYPPFSKHPEQFPNSKPINLIVRKPRKREEVREELGNKDDDIVILFAGGGTSVWRGLFSSINVNKKKGIVFLADLPTVSDNIKQVPKPFRLHDYINTSDLVISRGGYGTISETLAYGIRHLILVEENHPEAIENAKMLKKVNRAVVRNLNDFLNNPYDLIEVALNTKMNLSPIRSDGHIQAANRLFQIWEK